MFGQPVYDSRGDHNGENYLVKASTFSPGVETFQPAKWIKIPFLLGLRLRKIIHLFFQFLNLLIQKL